MLKLPVGRPPVNDPPKMLAYLQTLAQIQGHDPELVKVPGANIPAGTMFEFPGTLKEYLANAMLKMSKGPVGNVVGKNGVYTISNPAVPESAESDEEIITRIENRFSTLEKLTKGVCEGKHQAVVVSGAGGVGKTHMIERIVNHYKENEDLNCTVVRGGVITPINLYKLLWKTREAGAVLVLDDSDNIFNDGDSLTLLKGALDTSKVRKIAWMSQSTVLSNEGIDPIIEYKGNIIFVTNINFQAYIDAGRGALVPHLQALISRVHYLDLKLHTNRELVLWLRTRIGTNHILQSERDLSREQEMDVLQWMLEHKNNLRNLSIRTALQIAEYVTEYPSTWKMMASNIVLK